MHDQDNSGLFFFLVFLPVLVALGHDVFLFLSSGNTLELDVHTISKLYYEDKPGGFSFASLGFIWTKYSPETFRWAADSLTPEEWAGIRKFLSFKAVVIAAALSFFFYALISIARFFSGLRSGKRRRP